MSVIQWWCGGIQRRGSCAGPTSLWIVNRRSAEPRRFSLIKRQSIPTVNVGHASDQQGRIIALPPVGHSQWDQNSAAGGLTPIGRPGAKIGSNTTPDRRDLLSDIGAANAGCDLPRGAGGWGVRHVRKALKLGLRFFAGRICVASVMTQV